MNNRYEIRKISIWSAIKYGVAIGAGLGLVRGFLQGILLYYVVNNLLSWIASLTSSAIPLLLDVNVLDLLGLTTPATGLLKLGSLSFLMVIITTVGMSVAGALMAGLLAALAAIIFNLVASVSSGLVVTADSSQVTFAPSPAPAALPPNQVVPQPIQQPVPAAASVAASYPSVQPSAWLSSTSNAQQRWPVPANTVRIGSAPDNGIVLDGLEPYHAEIRFESSRYILYDLGSQRTWVNGRVLTGPNMLKSGFRVRLGTREFIFQSEV